MPDRTPNQKSEGEISDAEWKEATGMPVHIEMHKGMHIVKDDGGRVYGKHKTHEEAMAQMRAVNNAMHKEKTGKGFLKGKSKK